ncbi:MAG: hypothetical protein F4Z14_01580 [Gammaproteobacteria bacterium]|nr:hypothetical protein [Gammaproteobacteria bacterium]
MRIKLFGIACGIGFVGGLLTSLIIALVVGPYSPTQNTHLRGGQITSNSIVQTGTEYGFREILAIESPLLRSFELQNHLVDKSVRYSLDLLNETNELEHFSTVVDIQEFLIEHIAHIDPKKALQSVWNFKPNRRCRLLTIVFSEWTSRDTLQALQKATTLFSSSRKCALEAILEIHSDSSELLDIANSIGITHEIELLLGELEATKLLSEPSKALDLVFHDSLDDGEQEELIVSITNHWIATEGTEVFPDFLQMIKERFEATPERNFESKKLLSLLVERVSAYDPSYMWEVLMLESDAIQLQFASAVLKSWSKQDLQKTFKTLEKFGDPELQDRIYRSLVTNWASTEPKRVLNEIHMVRPEHRPNTIAVAVRAVFRQYGVEEALNSLTSLEEQGENVSQATMSFSRDWAKRDPNATINWILKTKKEDKIERFHLLRENLPSLTAVNPARAFEIAIENSSINISKTFSLEIKVLESIAEHHDFETLTDFTAKVSESVDPYTFTVVCNKLISHHSFAEALRFGTLIPEDLQHNYYGDLTFVWFTEKPESLAAHLLDFSTNYAKIVAQRALEINKRRQYLSAEEVLQLESLVNTNHSEDES